MGRDFQIHTHDIDRLRAELVFVVEYFGGLGYERCDVFFGWAWSTDRDNSDLLMKGVNTPLIDLDAEVRRIEETGLGNFGRDDVWVSFEGIAHKVQFCHHSGIHLLCEVPDDIFERFLERWRAARLDPIVKEKTEDPQS